MCVEVDLHRAASDAVSHAKAHRPGEEISDRAKLPLRLRRCSSFNPSVIGTGFNSVVFKCTDKQTGETFAVKEPRSPAARDACRSPQGQRDSAMLQGLRHENVVEHRHGCDDGSMVLEFLDGGSLLTVMEEAGGRLDEDRVSTFARQILRGVSYLHSKGVIHRDLKPANIFFDSKRNTAKVGDIAVASEMAAPHRSAGVVVPVGTPAFLAPEVVRSGKHAPASDIWALGCSVLQLATGSIPWEEEDTPFSALFKVGNGQHPHIPESMSPQLKSFLTSCFEPAGSRPSAEELLEHPFVNAPPAGPPSP